MTWSTVVTGLFALIGVVVGALLTGLLSAWSSRQTERRHRLDTALRSVAAAIASRDFLWRAEFRGAPAGLSAAERQQSENALYLRGVERHFAAVQQAMHDVGSLAADGVEVGEEWKRSPDFAGSLDAICDRLQKAHATSRSTRSHL